MRDELAHQWLGFAREEIESLLGEAGLRPRQYLVRQRRQQGKRSRGERWPDVFIAVADKPAAAAPRTR
jgi:hypothetical protein